MAEVKYEMLSNLDSFINILKKCREKGSFLSMEDQDLIKRFVCSFKEENPKIMSKEALIQEMRECRKLLQELTIRMSCDIFAEDEDGDTDIYRMSNYPYDEDAEIVPYLKRDFLYRDNALSLSHKCLGVIFWNLRAEGFRDEEIAKMFKTEDECVSDYCGLVDEDSFSYESPGDLDMLQENLIDIYKEGEPEPDNLFELEEEFTIAKTINNSIVRMYDYGLPTWRIMKTTNAYEDDVAKALERGIQDILLKANEWK